jgi:hypothetical protein
MHALECYFKEKTSILVLDNNKEYQILHYGGFLLCQAKGDANVPSIFPP